MVIKDIEQLSFLDEVSSNCCFIHGKTLIGPNLPFHCTGVASSMDARVIMP